jgi:hypothetical protein
VAGQQRCQLRGLVGVSVLQDQARLAGQLAGVAGDAGDAVAVAQQFGQQA